MQSLTRCRICGLPKERCRSIDGHDVCLDCSDTLANCTGCENRYITRSRYSFVGLCCSCSDTALIRSASGAEKLLAVVKAFCGGELNMPLSIAADLEVVDADTLSRIGFENASPNVKVDSNRLGMFQMRGDEYRIVLLSGMPSRVCLEVLAHEYAHAWSVQFGGLPERGAAGEGFAEWVAYTTLMHLGLAKQAEFKEKRAVAATRDHYQRGFLMMLQLARAHKG